MLIIQLIFVICFDSLRTCDTGIWRVRNWFIIIIIIMFVVAGCAIKLSWTYYSHSTQGGIKGFVSPKLSCIWLNIIAAEYVANLVNVNMWL